jgi:hypothetical protein
MKKFAGERNFSFQGALRRTMSRIPSRYARIAGIAFASAAFLWALAFTAVDARTPVAGDARVVAMLTDRQVDDTAGATAAEAMFPGAPDGVDPVVTGPVSAELRERQQALGCADAEWPNIPVACYPD